MKRYFPILIVSLLGACNASAQNSASVQTGASKQTKTSAQASKTGAQTSASGSASTSSSASASAGQNSADFASGTKINAILSNSLDAKKNKPGDRVEARTTQDVKQDGKVVLKKGSRLVGHVTQAQARAKGQTQSQLGIMFDHAVLKDGQEVPFNASIQALASAESAAAASGADDSFVSGGGMGAAQGSARSGGSLAGGVASTAGATAGAAGARS